jgi:DNA-binding transcriptional ArsR family regulator
MMGGRLLSSQIRARLFTLTARAAVDSAAREGATMDQPLHRFKAEFFKALGHPARLVILEQIRSGEKNVHELQTVLEIDQSSVSQQLAVLRNKNIVDPRKEGTLVYYRVRDPMIFQLLDVAQEIFNNHLIDTQTMLAQLSDEMADSALAQSDASEV